MSTCLRIDKQVTKACRNSIPGASEIWLANYDSIVQTGITYNTALNKITAIPVVAPESGYTSGVFYHIVLNKQAGKFTVDSVTDVAKGIGGFKPSIEFSLPGIDVTIRDLFYELVQATTVAIIKTLDGKYIVVGIDNGLDLETGSITSGMANNDAIGATIKLSGYEQKPYYELDATLSITTLAVKV